MGIQLLGASTGLSASDLITQPEWTLLASNTSTSLITNSTSITGIPSTYKKLKIVLHRINITGNGTSQFYFRPNNNTSGFYSGPFSYRVNGTWTNGFLRGDNKAYFGISQNVGLIGGEIIIENYSSSTEFKHMYIRSVSSNNNAEDIIYTIFPSSIPITSITFGTTTTGTTFYVNEDASSGTGILVYGAK